MVLVEAYRPSGVGPGPYEYLSRTQIFQVAKECAPDSSSLLVRPYVSVADQTDIPDLLEAHDPTENVEIVYAAPEGHPSGDVMLKLVGGHVGLVPAIGRDCTAIAFGRRVHDREYLGAFFNAAEANRVCAGRH